MTATTTQPKTIEALLAEGQRVLAKQEQRSREQQERREATLASEWMSLVKIAELDLGDWAGDFLHTMREDFGRDPYQFTLQLRPFGAATIFATYFKNSDGWQQRGRCGGRETFAVETAFEPEWFDEEWTVSSISHRSIETNDLAEAIAVCFRATAAYHVCEQECATKPPPVPAKAKTPELHLSASERDFVLALRRVIGDRIPE